MIFSLDLPSWLQAVILGIVQGVTEFVPVSSSGHLVLLPHLVGWERPGLAFDVALHVGTAAAILVYFRQELLGMLRAFLRPGESGDAGLYRRLGLLLVLASVPVAVAGLTLHDLFTRIFERPQVAAGFLLVTAGVLVAGERLRTRRVRTAQPVAVGPDASVGAPAGARRPAPAVPVDVGADPSDPRGTDLRTVTVRQALLVGAAQCLALFPGMSRSGATISAGIAAGLTRPAATRFSFLLALPALVGAALVSLPDLAEPGPYSSGDIAAGVAASFFAGYLAIAFLVRLVARVGLTVFVGYLLVAGLGSLLAVTMLGGTPA